MRPLYQTINLPERLSEICYLKVLFNGSMFTEKPTGVGIYIRELWNNLYKLLDEEKIEYKMYAYERKGLEQQKNILKIKLPFFLEIFFKNFLSIHRLLWNIFFLPSIAKDYDFVYSFSSHGSPFIKKQIITVHDLICFSFPSQHRFQYLYFNYMFPFIIKASKKIVVVSKFTKKEVVKYYKTQDSKIDVIYNGGNHLNNQTTTSILSNEEDIRSSLVDKKFFLTVGANYPHKNIERLLKAMEFISPELNLVIVGNDNAYYHQLKQQTEKNKQLNVFFLHYVSSALLAWLYKNCIANVYISLYEGFGFPPLEAALYNSVSVVSNTTALPEIYNDAVIYTDALNVNAIAASLTRVSSSSFVPDVYIRRFPVLIKNYKWRKTAQQIKMLIIQHLLNSV